MYQLEHRSQDQDRTLTLVETSVAQKGPSALAVFDLDGCLFDNRPRQVQILRVWAARHDVIELAALRPEHLQSWSMRESFERMGLKPKRAEDLAARARPFWERWFFDDAYVTHDYALPGAPRFVRRLHEQGARIVYLTGRTDSQRPSTLANLRRHGFPIDDDGHNLRTKPGPAISDRDFKREAFELIAREGRVASFFDNEPMHVNYAHQRFPEAEVVWVRTDHSLGSQPVTAGVRSVFGYLRTGDPELPILPVP
ncbi:MAG: HAD family hydrolase [Deltaproteobacteria bacterium]|nr:MAG: HAD family hydrolase [Deltaproteobacteria bacterium]